MLIFTFASVQTSQQFVLYFRAIYFAAYSKSKEKFNGLFVPNSGLVHMSSAGLAGEKSACSPLLYKIKLCNLKSF